MDSDFPRGLLARGKHGLTNGLAQEPVALGNLVENPKAHFFLIDYVHRRRVKLWGEARVIEDDAELTTRLMPKGYKARPSQVILFKVNAWDANCPQHIPRRIDAADAAAELTLKESKIAELEAEISALRAAVDRLPPSYTKPEI